MSERGSASEILFVEEGGKEGEGDEEEEVDEGDEGKEEEGEATEELGEEGSGDAERVEERRDGLEVMGGGLRQVRVA